MTLLTTRVWSLLGGRAPDLTVSDKMYLRERLSLGLVDLQQPRWHFKRLPQPITRRNFFVHGYVRTEHLNRGPHIGIGFGPFALYRSY